MKYNNFIQLIRNNIQNTYFIPFIKIIFNKLDYIRTHSVRDQESKCFIINNEYILFSDIYFITNELKHIKWESQLPKLITDINTSHIDVDINNKYNQLNIKRFFPFSYTLGLIKQFVEYHNFYNIFLDEILNYEMAFKYFPDNHDTRSTSHTFFIDDNKILRHMLSMFWENAKSFNYDRMYTLGRVFRVDNDSTHLPCFYQMDLLQQDTLDYCFTESFVKNLLEYLLENFSQIFNIHIKYEFKLRTRFHYFPYVDRPVEIDCYDHIDNHWMEILGGGITNQLHTKFLACGMGLERLCLIICKIMSQYIPDFNIIRNIHNLYDGSFILQP